MEEGWVDNHIKLLSNLTAWIPVHVLLGASPVMVVLQFTRDMALFVFVILFIVVVGCTSKESAESSYPWKEDVEEKKDTLY